MDPVKVTTERGVMTATLADVDNRNALGLALIGGLRDALAAANADPAVRALVVTNEGSTFCAGANLKERSQASMKASGSGGFETLLHEIQTSATPVVGRIAGHVVGGGNGLAAVLDISIAAEDVKFGFTEVRLGVVPAIISVVCLPKMRPGEAMEAFLRGHRFPASRAAELGLINRAVPGDQLDAAVAEMTARIIAKSPLTLSIGKEAFYRQVEMELANAYDFASETMTRNMLARDAAEGIDAFIEKRKPVWRSE